MQNSFKKSFMFLMLLLALAFSALGVTPALADDGVTPPADAPAVEEPVADVPVVDVPVAAETATGEAAVEEAPVVEAEQPAAEEELTVPEALEQLPEDTALVVLDENGEELPLVSQEAAEVVASADPYFWDGTQYIGYSTTGMCPLMVRVCNRVSNPIQAAVDAFMNSQTASGAIYIEKGTFNENVSVNGSNGNLTNLAGLIGAGSQLTTIGGYLDLYNLQNPFTVQGITMTDTLYANFYNTFSVEDVVVNSDSDSGIWLWGYDGDVSLTNVEANATCQGCRGLYFENGNGDVTISESNFNSDYSAAVKFGDTTGDVAITGGTYEGTDQGFLFDGHQGNVTLNDVSAYGGGYGGAFLINGNLTIDGGDYVGTKKAGVAMMIEGGDVSVMNAIIHDSPLGIAYSVDGTLKACNNVFSNNGTDIGGEGTFDDCGSVNPPVDQPLFEDKETKEFVNGTDPVPASEPLSEGDLPGSLPSDASFVAGVKVTQVGESITLEIPANMQGKSIRVLFWDGSTWVEVPSSVSADGKYITFQAAKAGSYVLVTP